MVRILITGDFCPINRAEEMALKGNFQELYNDFLPIIQNSDLAITNLECPLTNAQNSISKTGPAIKANPETIKLLTYGGFKLVTLANNHIMDYGPEGLNSTIRILEENNIASVGAGNNLAEAEKPFKSVIKGKTISVISLAENEFSTTHGNSPGTNPLDLINNYYAIKEEKKINDIVIVIYHGGNEEYNLPSPRLKETLRFFVEAGASAVVAHHSHRFSGYEVYKDSPIFYGIGNFLFDYKDNKGEEWQYAIAVSLNFEPEKPFVEIYPISQFDSKTSGVRLLNDSEKKDVLEKIDQLNKIIMDDEELKKRFIDFINKKEKQYQHFLEPHTNRILHGLMGRGFIPSFLSKKKRKLYLNLFRCESHRDVILKILENENRHS